MQSGTATSCMTREISTQSRSKNEPCSTSLQASNTPLDDYVHLYYIAYDVVYSNHGILECFERVEWKKLNAKVHNAPKQLNSFLIWTFCRLARQKYDAAT
jgi:hypothetical protein